MDSAKLTCSSSFGTDFCCTGSDSKVKATHSAKPGWLGSLAMALCRDERQGSRVERIKLRAEEGLARQVGRTRPTSEKGKDSGNVRDEGAPVR
jgi:hypothetical protein